MQCTTGSRSVCLGLWAATTMGMQCHMKLLLHANARCRIPVTAYGPMLFRVTTERSSGTTNDDVERIRLKIPSVVKKEKGKPLQLPFSCFGQKWNLFGVKGRLKGKRVTLV
jgi:hypothetical protein